MPSCASILAYLVSVFMKVQILKRGLGVENPSTTMTRREEEIFRVLLYIVWLGFGKSDSKMP